MPRSLFVRGPHVQPLPPVCNSPPPPDALPPPGLPRTMYCQLSWPEDPIFIPGLMYFGSITAERPSPAPQWIGSGFAGEIRADIEVLYDPTTFEFRFALGLQSPGYSTFGNLTTIGHKRGPHDFLFPPQVFLWGPRQVPVYASAFGVETQPA
jgi:hypothetical protein